MAPSRVLVVTTALRLTAAATFAGLSTVASGDLLPALFTELARLSFLFAVIRLLADMEGKAMDRAAAFLLWPLRKEAQA